VWVGLYVGVGGLPFVPYELFEPSTCMACAPYALFTVSHLCSYVIITACVCVRIIQIQASFGACASKAIGCSVLCRVISRYPDRGRLLIDAGVCVRVYTWLSRAAEACQAWPSC
jgi:D-serine deaminase-like pyridoxal phosphate-dependent protein